MPIGVTQHPQTQQPMLVVGLQPEFLGADQVLNLLRAAKKYFPGIYSQVHLEIVLPVDGGLVIPDDIAEKPNG